MDSDWPSSFEEAFTGPTPLLALRDAVVRARADGIDKDTLQRQLQAFRERLSGAGRDADEDVVLEVMDFLAGWSSPHMQIE